MTKSQFIEVLNNNHRNDYRDATVTIVHNITKLSLDLCTKIIRNLWTCSASEDFGGNLYKLLEASANPKIDFNPKIKTNNCPMYILYPDEHAAAFALYKIKQHKIKI